MQCSKHESPKRRRQFIVYFKSDDGYTGYKVIIADSKEEAADLFEKNKFEYWTPPVTSIVDDYSKRMASAKVTSIEEWPFD